MLTPKTEAAICSITLVMYPTNFKSFTYYKTVILRTVHPKKLFVIGQMVWCYSNSWLPWWDRKCVWSSHHK